MSKIKLKRLYQTIPLIPITYLLISTIFYFYLPNHGSDFIYTYKEFLKINCFYKIFLTQFLSFNNLTFTLNSIFIFITLYYMEIEIGRKNLLKYSLIYFLGILITSLFFKDYVFNSTSFLFYLFGFSLFLFPLKRPVSIPVALKLGYKEKFVYYKSRRYDPRSILIYSLISLYFSLLLTLIFLGIIGSDQTYYSLVPLLLCFFFGALANSLFKKESRRIVIKCFKLIFLIAIFFSFIIVLFYLMNLGLGTEEIPRNLEKFFSDFLKFFTEA